MRSNFVPHALQAGEGRCRICDLAYSQLIPKEVAVHRRFHRDYLSACDGVGAPVPEKVREKWREAGLAIQFAERVPFQERLDGAEKWLEAVYHSYLFGVLFHQLDRRMDLCEYFTKRVEGRDQLKKFQPDVAKEMRRRYSARAMC